MKYNEIESIQWEQEFPKVPVCVQDAVSDATRQILMQSAGAEQQKARKVAHFPRKRMLLLVAVLTLLSGMTVLAATALWKDRMAAMNQEEMEAYFLSITTSNAPAFRYNRSMSEDERQRQQQLTQFYEEEGLFPASALTMLETAAEYKGKGVGYDALSGTFFLPDAELTDEELLQIIDFYHKVDYSLATVNEQVESGALEVPTEEEVVVADGSQVLTSELTFQALNDKVAQGKVLLAGEERVNQVAAGEQFLYLGSRNQVKRVSIGGTETEVFYELPEGVAVFSMTCDGEENLYLSVCDYQEQDGMYTYENNRILKIDVKGQQVAEFHLQSELSKQGIDAEDSKAYWMQVDDKGQLYVKFRWCTYVEIYVFDAQGAFVGVVEDKSIPCHAANGMCLGEDGALYLLAEDTLVKIDTDTLTVAETYTFGTEDMVAAVSIVYPMDEDSFYICSYDGLFQYNLGEMGSERILVPFETDAFAEGCRWSPISGELLAVTNSGQDGLVMSYFRMAAH